MRCRPWHNPNAIAGHHLAANMTASLHWHLVGPVVDLLILHSARLFRRGPSNKSCIIIHRPSSTIQSDGLQMVGAASGTSDAAAAERAGQRKDHD